jgi:hypothetical protein
VHFKKHRLDVGRPFPASPEEYMGRSIASAAGQRGTIEYYFDTTSFDKGYQSNVVRWNRISLELT